MNTLFVRIPAHEIETSSTTQLEKPLLFAVLNKAKEIQETGAATLNELPKAQRTSLIIAARDILILDIALPTVSNTRLKQVLPNILEDLLIQDAQQCHIAVAPLIANKIINSLDGENAHNKQRKVAIIDRTRLRHIFDAFKKSGHKIFNILPEQCCCFEIFKKFQNLEIEYTQKSLEDQESEIEQTARLEFEKQSIKVVLTAKNINNWECIVYQAEHEYGISIPEEDLFETLNALNMDTKQKIQFYYDHTALPDFSDTFFNQYTQKNLEDQKSVIEQTTFPEFARRSVYAAQPITWSDWIESAQKTQLNLCQYEFDHTGWKFKGISIKQWRLSLILLGFIVLTQISATNLYYRILKNKYQNLMQQIQTLVRNTFPQINVIIDAPQQMHQHVALLRSANGTLNAFDFETMIDKLALTLKQLSPTIPARSIAQITYQEQQLKILFKPEISLDATSLQQQFKNYGILATQDTQNAQQWILTAS